MAYFRVPARFNLIVVMCLCVLSAVALETIVNYLKSKISFFKEKFVPIIYILVIAISTFDLNNFAYSYTGFYPVSDFIYKPKLLKYINDENQEYRIYSTSQYDKDPYLDSGWMGNQKKIVNFNESIPGNLNIASNLSSATDFGWQEGGLRYKEQVVFENYILRFRNKEFQSDTEITSKLLGLWNVKHIISYWDMNNIGYKEIASVDGYSSESSRIFLYENLNVLPRVYFVDNIVKFNNSAEIYKQFDKGNIPSIDQVFVTDDVSAVKTSAKNNNVKIVVNEPKKVVMSVEVNDSAYLLFSDINYPGWEVYLDSKKGKIINGNLIQRLVLIPKGTKSITWEYKPKSLYIGASISVSTAIIMLYLVLMQNKKFKFEYKYDKS